MELGSPRPLEGRDCHCHAWPFDRLAAMGLVLLLTAVLAMLNILRIDGGALHQVSINPYSFCEHEYVEQTASPAKCAELYPL